MQAGSTIHRRVLLGAAVVTSAAALLGCDARIENEKKRSVRLGDPVGLAQTEAAGFTRFRTTEVEDPMNAYYEIRP